MTTEKRTTLYTKHLALGAKMVEFGGWQMPVQYKGILDEHQAVRTKAGLFDVSHMGEIAVCGSGALPFLQKLLTNDLQKMSVGQALYSPMCDPTGGIVDDLLVYRIEAEKYLLVVNAGNKDKDWEWINDQAANSQQGMEIRDLSDEIGLLALQGPLAQEILTKLSTESLENLKYYHFIFSQVAGIEAVISRTGYTGEDGFELYLAADKAPFVWDELLDAGQGLGLAPAGLGARDTLRFEACLPLYGHELSATITPLEAGLGFFVAWSKENFIGKEALLKQKEAGIPRKLVGFSMLERGIPRAGYTIKKDGVSIGEVSSGTYAPTLGQNLGLGLVSSKEAIVDNEISVSIRDKDLKAKIIKKPFYKKGGK